jgi:hypothetical protein
MEKQTEEEKEYSNLLSDIRELSKSSPGKNFIWHVLSLCNLYTESFTGNSHTFHLEGKRSVGLQVLLALEDADPTLYARLLLDKQKQKRSNNV